MTVKEIVKEQPRPVEYTYHPLHCEDSGSWCTLFMKCYSPRAVRRLMTSDASMNGVKNWVRWDAEKKVRSNEQNKKPREKTDNDYIITEKDGTQRTYMQSSLRADDRDFITTITIKKEVPENYFEKAELYKSERLEYWLSLWIIGSSEKTKNMNMAD